MEDSFVFIFVNVRRLHFSSKAGLTRPNLTYAMVLRCAGYVTLLCRLCLYRLCCPVVWVMLLCCAGYVNWFCRLCFSVVWICYSVVWGMLLCCVGYIYSIILWLILQAEISLSFAKKYNGFILSSILASPLFYDILIPIIL